jgi:hypothetical protein
MEEGREGGGESHAKPTAFVAVIPGLSNYH